MKVFDYAAVHSPAGVAVVLATVAFLALSCELNAQQLTVLRNVNVIDGTGAPPQRSRTVTIAGDRIRSISSGQAPASSKAAIRDMHGLTIMPLIINTHGHLGLVKGTSLSTTNQTDDNLRHQLLRYQEYGVGAVLSMGTDGQNFAQIREASRRGTLPGADVFSAGIGLGAKDGVPPASVGFNTVLRPTTPDEARKNVADQAPLRPDFIKIWVDDFWGKYPKMQPDVYGAIIDEAHKHALRVAAHLYHIDDARALVADGVDVIAHSIRDGDIDDALLADMKKHRVAYIPTLSLDDFAFAYDDSPAWIDDPFFRAALDPGVLEMITSPDYKAKTRASKATAQETKALPVAMRNLKKIYDAGILVALGTDSGATPIRVQGFAEHMELVLMVQAGLTPLQAITVATKNAAQLLGVADQFGTLEPGKKANFIVLEKDPSQDIHNTQSIRGIWKNGIQVSDGPVRGGQPASINVSSARVFLNLLDPRRGRCCPSRFWQTIGAAKGSIATSPRNQHHGLTRRSIAVGPGARNGYLLPVCLKIRRVAAGRAWHSRSRSHPASANFLSMRTYSPPRVGNRSPRQTASIKDDASLIMIDVTSSGDCSVPANASKNSKDVSE